MTDSEDEYLIEIGNSDSSTDFHSSPSDSTVIYRSLGFVFAGICCLGFAVFLSFGLDTQSPLTPISASEQTKILPPSSTTKKSFDSSDESTTKCDIVGAFNNMPKNLKETMKANDNTFMNEAMPEVYKYFENEIICDPLYSLPAFELMTPPPIELNCADPRYGLVLNGELAEETKHIVDLIIFGFNVHYLEIRLYENYDIVDDFYILEQSISHRGYKKPFYLPQVLNTPRFLPFKDKIHYIQDHMSEEWIQEHLRGDNANLYSTETGGRQMSKQYFLDHYKSKNVSLNNVYVLQNDGDEIISRSALYHFKYCQDKSEFPVYAPNIVFKQNVYISNSANSEFVGIEHWPEEYADIKSYLWYLGPHIWRADMITEKSFSMRRSKLSLSNTNHLGYGAANHFSNPGHPILHYIKVFSTFDHPAIAHSELFWTHLENGDLTLEMIEHDIFKCKANVPYVLLETVLSKESQAMIQDNLPWIVKKYPQRYPFLTALNRREQQKEWFKEKCPDASA